MRDQWLVWGRRLQMAGLAAVLGAAVLWAGSPAGAVNDMVVDPTTGLHDGQVVQVTLNNWDFSLSSVDLMQCNPGAQQLADCAVAETQVPFPIQDSTGTGPYTVKLLTGLVNCDRTHPCALVAVSDATNFVGNSREVQLTFADDAPSTTTTTGASTTTTTTTGSSTTSTTAGGTTTSTGGSSTTTTTTGSSSSTTSTSTSGSSTTTTASVTTTSARTPAGSATTVTSSPSLPFQATGATLPRTGLGTQMLWLLATGVVLAGAGSLVRRHALAVEAS